MPAVRRLAAQDIPAVAAIVVALPDYFTDEVAGQVERDCARHDAWVLTDSDEVAGFAVAQRKSAGGAEILWMAVAPGRRGRGNGTMLLNHVLDDLASAGIRLVEVKTLDRSAGYPPYEATCAFWERRGFIQLDTIDPLPGGNRATRRPSTLRPSATGMIMVLPPGERSGAVTHDSSAWPPLGCGHGVLWMAH
jgi:GNAT superfamily N-acetyltransferase